MQEMQRKISSVSYIAPVDVCNQAGDWYQGFIVEEKVDRIVVHVNGWEHKWNESIPNSKVKQRVRQRNISTKVGPLGAENPDRVLEDWQRLKLKEMIEDQSASKPIADSVRGRRWNAVTGTWIHDADAEDSSRAKMGCFAAEVAGIKLKTSPWSQPNILGCDGDSSFTEFGLTTSEAGSPAGVWQPGDVVEVTIDRCAIAS